LTLRPLPGTLVRLPVTTDTESGGRHTSSTDTQAIHRDTSFTTNDYYWLTSQQVAVIEI